MMNKSVLGLLSIVIAILNIYWASEFYNLKKVRGSKQEVDECIRKANRLAFFSRVSYFCVGIVFLVFILLEGISS